MREKIRGSYRSAVSRIHDTLATREGAFLRSYRGLLLYSVTVFSIYLSHLGFLDLSPAIFGGHGPNGLTIAPVDGNVPIRGRLNLLISSSAATIIVVLGSVAVTSNRRDHWALPLIAGSLYWMTMCAAEWLPGVLIDAEGVYTTPPIQYLATIMGAVSLTTLLWVFKRPLLPKQEFTTGALDRYIQNQWRFAQIILSITVALVVGVSVPFALQYAKTWLFGIGFLILFLVAVPLSVLFFISLRIHLLEKESREDG